MIGRNVTWNVTLRNIEFEIFFYHFLKIQSSRFGSIECMKRIIFWWASFYLFNLLWILNIHLLISCGLWSLMTLSVMTYDLPQYHQQIFTHTWLFKILVSAGINIMTKRSYDCQSYEYQGHSKIFYIGIKW